MPIAIACIDCGFAARVKDHLGGKVVECPKCKAGIHVPTPSDAEQATARPQPEPPRTDRAEPPNPTPVIGTDPDDDRMVEDALVVDDDDEGEIADALVVDDDEESAIILPTGDPS